MREFYSLKNNSNNTALDLSVDGNLPDVIRNWNVPDDQVWWSRSYEQVFGQMATSSNSEQSWFENIHPDDKQRVIDSVSAAFNMRQVEWSSFYKLKKADNSYLDIQDQAFINYQDNIPIQLVGFIKVNKSVPETKVVEMQQITSMVLEASESASFSLVLENNSLVYSPGFSKVLTGDNNYPATRQIFLEHIHPDDISIRQEAYRLAEISGILTYEARFIWKDGSVHWIKILARYVYDTTGKAVSITGIATDVTEQIERKIELDLAREKFSFAFENAPVGMLFTDDNGVIHRINDRFAKLLGETREELVGRSFDEFTFSSDLEESRRIFRDLIGGKLRHLTKEKRFLRKDQKEQWARITTNSFESEGQEKVLSIAYDINNEIQAIAQQKRLLSIIDHSTDVISVFDDEGKFTYINKIGKKLLDINDIEEITISDIFSSDYLFKLKRETLSLYKGDRNWTGRQLYKNQKTGELIDVMTYVFVLEDRFTGLPAGYASIGRDIRAELDAEKKLRDSERLFRNITDASTAALWMTDENGSLTYISKTWMEWTGVSLESHLGNGWLNYVASEDFENVTASFRKDFTSRSFHDMQFCISHVDKTVRCVVCKGAPQYNDDQKFTGYIGAILDITELVEAQKQQEQAQIAIKASEKKFRSLIEQSPVACALYLGPEQFIEFTNEAMIKIWGKGNMVQGKKLIEVLPELVDQPYPQILKNVYDSGKAYHAHSAPADVAVNGVVSTYYFDVSYTPLFDGDNIVYGILEMAVDVTERVLALHELQRSEQQYRDLSGELEARVQARTKELNLANRDLISSNQSLEQFAYAASHDLQEPLRKVVSFGTRFASRYEQQLDDDGKYLLSRMQDAAERMSLMISDLLSFSRLQVNHKVFAEVDLNRIIASVLSDLEIVIEEKRAVFDIKLLDPVWGDTSQLTQLFLNLVSNALKYQPAGQIPYISVSTTKVDPSEINQTVLAGHPYLRIQVKDNGIGFDQKHADRIFQMFQRLHGKSEYSGSGIGLALCNKVVQNHYGLLTAESEIGQGSCFSVYLPAPVTISS
ncbi:PAS domain S-box protein [Dyadobacter psychrotolerans]|uniref:histidine kinase n=1 Tax=Dyadobacter psychrotolerans TaxID=2541721 RepID=A0A4R5DYR2_9BACT|nr:PAS domain S-box protein [Dyadobacter psychrotolerans]TDE16333.1 PAS domain S-box protein [Dyadobacter psychrotolerans]